MVGGRKVARKHGDRGGTDQTFLIGSFFGLIQMCVAVFQELIKKIGSFGGFLLIRK